MVAVYKIHPGIGFARVGRSADGFFLASETHGGSPFELGSGGETAQNVMTKASPANGDVARVEYKLSISGTQAAGTYSNTVTYIATPTF